MTRSKLRPCSVSVKALRLNRDKQNAEQWRRLSPAQRATAERMEEEGKEPATLDTVDTRARGAQLRGGRADRPLALRVHLNVRAAPVYVARRPSHPRPARNSRSGPTPA